MDDPPDNPQKNFEIFWNDFDKMYSFFEYKNINWDSVYAVYNPLIDENTTEEELFEILKKMVLTLKDGHVNLWGPEGVAYTDWYENYPSNTSYLAPAYIQEMTILNEALSYGEITNTQLGYIQIKSFSGSIPVSSFENIDEILTQFQDKQGIVIDIRSNGGGADKNAEAIAQRFTNNRRLYRKIRYRNGPEHNDFTAWINDYIEPGGTQFLKPVALLTNRRCFSSTEDFILAMRVNPKVITVGDTTGGGSGNPIFRELPNGWTYRLSRWQEVDPEGKNFEGKGLYPSIPVWITQQDSINGKDRILETAIEYLENQ